MSAAHRSLIEIIRIGASDVPAADADPAVPEASRELLRSLTALWLAWSDAAPATQSRARNSHEESR